MSGALTNPLQAMLAKASQSLPRITGETARHQQRHDAAGDTLVILADVSSSMGEYAGTKTKHLILDEALNSITPDRQTVAFHSVPKLLSPGEALPQPAGGTGLHFALDYAVGLRPRQTIVISDGRPDDEAAALRAADALPGRIDVIYVGPDDDVQALKFMRELARRGLGQVIVRDLVRGAGRATIGREIQRLMLGAPGK